jgi:hypothetical protein
MIFGADQKFGINLLRDTGSEIGARYVVDGYDRHSAEHACKECRNPFRRVLAPEQDAIAFANHLFLQLCGELIGKI